MKEPQICSYKLLQKWRLANFLLILLLFSHFNLSRAETTPFRLSLLSEPDSLSPLEQNNPWAGYLYQQVHAQLLFLKNGQLKPKVGLCQQKKNRIYCTIKSNYKWSDQKPITGLQFAETIQKFLDPKNKAFRADLFFSIKNAQKIYQGLLPLSQLGVHATENTIDFEVDSPSEFMYVLASPILAPTRSDNPNTYSGPYQIKSWVKGNKISLIPNLYFDPSSASHRPPLEFLVLAEDSISVQLYEKNQLDFVRRLPVVFIEKYKKTKDYLEIPLFRFDYIGFNPALLENKNLRESLATSLDYNELQKLFASPERPGCIGVSRFLRLRPSCFKINSKQLKLDSAPKLTLSFSRLGGENHRRAMQWIQSQWFEKLGIKVELLEMENKLFINQIKNSPSPLYRLGVTPDRPTCLSVLENLPFKVKSNSATCQTAMDEIISESLLIPMGPMYFSMLIRPQWIGWSINEMNVLDLVNLKNRLK